MKDFGEVKNFKLAGLFTLLGRVFRSGWMLLAIGLLAVGFFSLLTLLSWADVSFVIPATALSYVVGGLGAKLLLGERLPPARWAGIVLVSVGVALVCAS
jgi:drug/metabolite transporter (DMT)-like permease